MSITHCYNKKPGLLIRKKTFIFVHLSILNYPIYLIVDK